MNSKLYASAASEGFGGRWHPRNSWGKILDALIAVRDGDLKSANNILDSVQYARDMPAEAIAYLQQYIAQQPDPLDTLSRLDVPSDYWTALNSMPARTLRKLARRRAPPQPFPRALALPPIIGAGNDFRFIHEAAAAFDARVENRHLRIHVAYSASNGDIDLQLITSRLLSHLQIQELRCDLDVSIFNTTLRLKIAEEYSRGVVSTRREKITDSESHAYLNSLAPQYDFLIFLDGDAVLDSYALRRAVRLLATSNRVIAPFVEAGENLGSPVLFSSDMGKAAFSTAYPFRKVMGMNFAVSKSLYLHSGGISDQFGAASVAAKEFAFRCYNIGSWFAPVGLPQLRLYEERSVSYTDRMKYIATCPNHWDRKADGSFENPKVSIYIPAYNAQNFIEDAIESVLMQDFQDLEVCICDDGSDDGTLARLKDSYGTETKVRWESLQNGGIGSASNYAIGMSNSQYIGQLDSDDRLLPHAVRTLVHFLDENPPVVCAYSSCGRIDATGNVIGAEYSWPVFSREKMMVTSIAHHFRMFRRCAWNRTSGFRHDIVNAVDYDLFLQLCEVGSFHHIDEILYQRRWHGSNTSIVNESSQTANTYRVQELSLERQGLRHWEVFVPNSDAPRRVSYRLKSGTPVVVFEPDYSASNPYQPLLYRNTVDRAEVVGGNIDAVLQMLDDGVAAAGDVVFHLHWINHIFDGLTTEADAEAATSAFLSKVQRLVAMGGRFVWTIHNALSHDATFPDIELKLSAALAESAHVLHFHANASIAEAAHAFPIDVGKCRVSHHGNYHHVYPNFISRRAARMQLGISLDSDVLLFCGQVRPYKGVEQLVEAFRLVLRERPRATLIIAGRPSFPLFESLQDPLNDFERARILYLDRFIDNGELQVLYGAADFCVLPYTRILTSGSLMLALTFGKPVVMPEVGMSSETIGSHDVGILYSKDHGVSALATAIREMLDRKDAGQLRKMSVNSLALGRQYRWPDISDILFD